MKTKTKLPADIFVPVKKWHSNCTHKLEGCHDLPTTVLKDQIISVWKCKSIWERIKFLFNGEITLSVMGKGQPPITLFSGDPLKPSEA